MFGFDSFQPVIKMIEELEAEAGKEKWEAPSFPPEFDELYTKLAKGFTADFEVAFKETDKLKRGELIAAAAEKFKATLAEDDELRRKLLRKAGINTLGATKKKLEKLTENLYPVSEVAGSDELEEEDDE